MTDLISTNSSILAAVERSFLLIKEAIRFLSLPSITKKGLWELFDHKFLIYQQKRDLKAPKFITNLEILPNIYQDIQKLRLKVRHDLNCREIDFGGFHFRTSGDGLLHEIRSSKRDKQTMVWTS